MQRDSKKPEYSYRDGLNSLLLSFKRGGGVVETTEHIPERDLYGIAGIRDEVLTRVFNIVERDLGKTYSAPTSKGSLRYAIVNGENSEGKLTVYGLGWGGTFDSPLTIREVGALVAKNSDQAYLVYNSPGTGGSSPLPDGLGKELAETGHYAETGSYLASALEEAIKNFDTLNLVGISKGAREIIGIAVAIRDTIGRLVEEVRVIDPPGSRAQGLFEFARTFVVDEGINARGYAKASLDEESKERQMENDSNLSFISKVAELMHWDSIHQIQAMCPAALSHDLSKALVNIRARLLINSPEFSCFNNPQNVKAILQVLAMMTDRPKVIQQRIVEGRSHSLVSANPGVLARLLM